MSAAISCLLVLATSLQDAEPPAAELRAALDDLRTGTPGEPDFEAALPRLPDLIRSRSSWFVAGGAFLAGEHGRRECVPGLIEALRDGRARGWAEGLPVLDSLIRLEVTVEPGKLVLDPAHPAESLILLGRDAQANQDELVALLKACDEDEAARWGAACLLVERRDVRVAELLLASTSWPLDVTVRDAGSEDSVGRGFGGRRIISSHPPWPPKLAYHLDLPGAGEALSPIRFERRVYAKGLHMPPPVDRVQRSALRARLLGALLGDSTPNDSIRESEDLTVDWSDAASFERELRGHLQGLRARISSMARALEEHGLLAGAEDVRARATIRVAIHDLRDESVGSLPRPEIPGVVYE